MRLRVESSPRPTDDSDPLGMQPRTLSFLNIIDLAGSESAKVQPYRVPRHLASPCTSVVLAALHSSQTYALSSHHASSSTMLSSHAQNHLPDTLPSLKQH